MAGVCSGPGPCDTTPTGHGGKNWVTKTGGLSPYLRAIVHALIRSGHTQSEAIQIGVGTLKRWAAGGGNVSAATRARAAAALADWESKRAASHSLTAEQRAVIELAAVNGHHVAGSAYHWRHNWRPLDVRTALTHRQFATARKLHAGGANHFNPEPGHNFVQGVKPLNIGVSKHEPKPAAPPKALTPDTSRLKALIKSMPAEQRTKPHLWDDPTLQNAAELGHEKAKTHLIVRDHIKRRFSQQAERHAAYNAKRAERGEPAIPFTEPSHAQLQDLERRQVNTHLKAEREMLKREQAQEAARAAKAKAATNPDELKNYIAQVHASHGGSPGLQPNRYSWTPDELRKAAALGDEQSVRALPYVEKRAKKQAREAAKRDEVAARAAAGTTAKGAPVSAALDNRTKGTTSTGVQRALAAIDKVHSDGELYQIPVKPSAAGTRYGQYTHSSGHAANDLITISGGGDHHSLTTAHEIGHWLDYRALNPDGRQDAKAASRRPASEDAANAGHHQLGLGMTPPASPAWDAWWQAVTESEAVKGLRTTPAQGSEKYRRYTLTPREIWARSYAQYIAHRSGDTKMQQEAADLVALRQLDDHRVLQGYTQWTPQDFAPVAAAIDRILAEKGWRK